MAKGVFNASGSSSSNENIDIGTVGATETLYVRWITLMVQTAGTTSRVLVRSGSANKFIARMATTTADSILAINFLGERRLEGGNPCVVGDALRITTSGGAAATINYDIGYEVR